MNTHIVLADAKLKRTISTGLGLIPLKNVNCRLAHLSGCNLALSVVLAWELLDRPFLQDNFRFVFDEFHSLTAGEAVYFIANRSLEKIVIAPEIVPNPGLLKGTTLKYYSSGFKTCFTVLMGQVRECFAARFDESYSYSFQKYLEDKLESFEVLLD